MKLKKEKENNKNQFWRSVESKESDLSSSSPNSVSRDNNPLAREFPDSVQTLIDRGVGAGLNRKSFFTLMGASIAMMTASCSRKPIEKILPYLQRPGSHVPGLPTYYATSYVHSEGVLPLIIKTKEGKPIKVEGNPDHPLTEGGMSADGFATIWDLYDPDRLKHPSKKTKFGFRKISWKTALKEIQPLVKKKIHILKRPSYSPSEQSLLQRFTDRHFAELVVYDTVGVQHEILSGQKLSHGDNIIPRYQFDKADLILSIEADFLGTWISPELFAKQFSTRRDPDADNMNKLISVETMMSLTGANSDLRIPIKSGSHRSFILGLAHILLPFTLRKNDISLRQLLKEYTPKMTAQVCGVDVKILEALAKEILKFKGRILVVAGGTSTREENRGSSHYLGNLINYLVGSSPNSIMSQAPQKSKNDISSHKKLKKLIQDMQKGEVETLIIDHANPVYDLPRNSGFSEALSKVKNVIFIGTHRNETAEMANYMLAASHFMESWGDGYSYGIYHIVQPVIRPLFDTRSAGDIFLSLQKRKESFHNYVQKTSIKYIKNNWQDCLANGFLQRTNLSSSQSERSFNIRYVFEMTSIQAPINKGYVLNLYQNIQIGDGRGANISFRQELPDPITKVTWGNFLAVSPLDARKNGWKTGDKFLIKNNDQEILLPAFIQPGLVEGSVAAAMGYGHSSLGKIGKNIGANIFKLAEFNERGTRYTGLDVDLKKIPGKIKIATTQRHYEIPGLNGRGLANATILSKYKINTKAGHSSLNDAPGSKNLPGKGLYVDHKYDGYRWGMNIDLNKCTGCSACVISCYSENNIPAVGKKEILVGREMSWLRIDRYYSGDEINPEVVFQPVMCQHCENAPCENVCPVVATTHSHEGLNEMAYNRCIGTRYCANNCPYKVRRFNWLENWEGKLTDPQQYALNPDVTVRSRGVIEKCSFCIQRIAEKRQTAKLSNRQIYDGELLTACQQGCPSNAIVFGNINDKESKVFKQQNDQRSYRALLSINVKPSVTYMTKVKNV